MGTPARCGSSRWLANRSFVGQDGGEHIIVGTTTDAFFPLDRFARFLLDAPLGLAFALNLDGGPVASQGIALNGFERRSYGQWEAKVEGDRADLLMWPYGSVAMPDRTCCVPALRWVEDRGNWISSPLPTAQHSIQQRCKQK